MKTRDSRPDVIQIISADGWYVQTYQFDRSGKEPTFERVACWGLTKDGSACAMLPDGLELSPATEGSLWYVPGETRRFFTLSEEEFVSFKGNRL